MTNKRQIAISFLIIIFLFSIVIFSYAENQAAPQALTVQQLKEDTDFFFKTIEDTHPNIYFKLSKEDYDNYKNLCYEKIKNPMTAEDYWKTLSEFLNKFSDGHTRIYPSKEAINTNLMPPFLTEWMDGQLVITKTFGNYKLGKGDSILYINDVSAQEYLDSIMRYKSYNDYQSARKSISRGTFCNSLALKSKRELVINTADKKVFKWTTPVFDKKDKIFEDYYLSDTNNFVFWDDLNAGYLDFNKFWDRQCEKAMAYWKGSKPDEAKLKEIPDFSEMLERIFNKLNSSNSKYLVIDIRGNGGGNSILGNQLLNYIVDDNEKLSSVRTDKITLSKLLKEQAGEDGFNKFLFSKFSAGTVIDGSKMNGLYKEYEKQQSKSSVKEPELFKFPKVKNKFKGKLILLIDNYVFSSAEIFAVTCKDSAIAIIIGEPTGGGVTHPGDVLSFILPNSKFAGSVSHKIFVREDKSRINERAVYPDYYVYQTIEDFRAGKDTVLEFVKKGIRENKF